MNKHHTMNINWDEIDSVPEEEYNYYDSPEVTPEMFKNIQILMPEETKKVNIRIKSNTIEFFKKNSKHYQTMINAVLDAYVEASKSGKIAH